MNVLLYDTGSWAQRNLIFFLEKRSCRCHVVPCRPKDICHDDFFEEKLEGQLSADVYDFVISTDFSPIAAKVCFRQQTKYISWMYESPAEEISPESYQFPTSYLFHYDRIEAERLARLGGIHIYHMPLAVNCERLAGIPISPENRQLYGCDVSFVGNFYSNSLKEIMAVQDDYDKGYIDSVVNAQLNVYGYNFVEEMISDEMAARMSDRIHGCGITGGLTKNGIVSSINQLVTQTECVTLLQMLGQAYRLFYYSDRQPELLSDLAYRDITYYLSEMPRIFKLSRLNLNPTPKGIQSGIPLRALAILGCGGALLSNYQPELAEYFTDGEDVILYDSIEDALCKADYYLKHEDLRAGLAQKGFQKTAACFSYPDRISSILKTAGIL